MIPDFFHKDSKEVIRVKFGYFPRKISETVSKNLRNLLWKNSKTFSGQLQFLSHSIGYLWRSTRFKKTNSEVFSGTWIELKTTLLAILWQVLEQNCNHLIAPCLAWSSSAHFILDGQPLQPPNIHPFVSPNLRNRAYKHCLSGRPSRIRKTGDTGAIILSWLLNTIMKVIY